MYPAEVERALVEPPGCGRPPSSGSPTSGGAPGCAPPWSATSRPGEVIDHARAHLAAYKCPKDVFVVDELPHTSTGKLQRLALVQALGLARRGAAPTDR